MLIEQLQWEQILRKNRYVISRVVSIEEFANLVSRNEVDYVVGWDLPPKSPPIVVNSEFSILQDVLRMYDLPKVGKIPSQYAEIQIYKFSKKQ
jgi:hypothetical protein